MFSRPTGVINMIHKMHLGQFAYASEEVEDERFPGKLKRKFHNDIIAVIT